MIDLTTLTLNTDPFLLFFGSFYLVIGLSIFFANDQWKEFIKLFAQHDSLSLVLGVLTLPISLFIVVFYDNWDTLASTILMIMGYIGLVKAAILLLWPKMLQKFVGKQFVQKYIWLDGLSGVILGAAMLLL